METTVDLLDGVDSVASVLVAGEREYDGDRFVKTVYKTGNYLRHCGVHERATVELHPVAAPETIFGLLGTAVLGGQVSFDPGSTEHPKARLGPTAAIDGESIPAGCKPIGFGDPPADPSWAYFERAVWSENPFFPDTEVDAHAPAIISGAHSGHSTVPFVDLFEAAGSIAESYEPGDTVAIRADIGHPGTIAGGIIAPLRAGATILLPTGAQTGSVAITEDSAPEVRRIDPTTVFTW